MDVKDMDKHWELVINTMNEGVLIVSKEGKILSVNRSFEEMTGHLAKEVVGRPVKWPSTTMVTGGASCSNPNSRKCAAADVLLEKRTGLICRP